MLRHPSQSLRCRLASANSRGESRPVDHVGRDQAAEEHDLGGQEDPHAQVRRVVLLLQVVELVHEDRLGRRQRRGGRRWSSAWASSASSGE